MSNDKKLIINELKVRNVGPLKMIDVKPKGDITYLTGPNGAGKTFALDCISFALSGAYSYSGVEKVIREGAEEEGAEILVDLGDYRVTREWKSEDDYRLKMVRVMDDGEELEVKAPQGVLDSFGKTIGMDPLEMARKDSADMRREFLLEFVDIDLDELELERKEHFDHRTEVNRTVKSCKAKLQQYEDLPEELPEPIDVAEEAQKLQKINEHNSKVDRAKERKSEILDDLEEKEREVIEAQEALKKAHNKRDEAKQKFAEAKKWIEKNPKKDAEEIQQRMEEAREIDQLHSRASSRDDLAEELEWAEQKSQELTEKIEDCDRRKVEAVQEAPLPIDGLEIGDNDVMLEGRAFSQYSEGERLKYATLMLVGSEPRFKVIGIKGANSLDSKNEQIIKDIAREHGFQLWIEKTDETGEVGLVFEQGEITKDNSSEE